MEFNKNVLRSDEKAVYGLRSIYEKYGYSYFKMSKFEEYDLYVRNKDFLISDSVITFTDTNGRLMALKPDVTLSIIKNSSDKKDVTEKLYYNENVYRVSGSSHTYKEIMQTGLECVGDVDMFSVCEVITLAVKSLAELSDNYVLDISHMGIITGLLDDICISEENKEKIIRCIGEKNAHEIEKICKSADVSAEDTGRILNLVKVYGPMGEALKKIESICVNESMKNALRELNELYEVIEYGGMSECVNLDFSVANDMKYYNGIVFQGFISGIPESILSGGQYDKLMKKMGKKYGAIGFAVYIDLLERLDEENGESKVDILLLYDDKTDAKTLTCEVKRMAEGGKSILLQKSVPGNIKYGRLMKITGEGAADIENDN